MAAADPLAQDVITCDLCSAPVELYCDPCHANLCAACSVKHMQLNPSKTHHVVLYRKRMFEPVHPVCESHSDRKCEMFCKTCERPICSKCVTTSHKKHEFIDIEENILSSMKSIIESDSKELEHAIIPTYEGINSELGEKSANLQQEYNEVEKHIDEHGINWHKEIDIVIQKQKTEAQKTKERNLNTLQSQQEEMQNMLSLARDVLKRNQNLLKSGDVTQIKNYKSRNEELRTIPPRISWTLPSFEPIRIQGEYLYRQFGELKAAIELEIEESKIRMKQLTKPQIDINVETKTNRLFGLSYLPVDKMWIFGDKDTIDLIDIHGTVLETVKTLSGKMPLGLTITKEGHLIYGDYTTGNINMVKNSRTSTILTLPSGWIPNDMCFTLSDDLLILMYRGDFTKCKVVRYDKDYKVVQEVQYDDKGAPLFTPGDKRMYMTENKNTDFCVSNENAKNVVAVNQSGKLRWRYTGNLASHKYESFNPYGIATDSQCHVLVADLFNKCIHVIDKAGQFIMYIENCDIFAPHCLSIDAEDRLFVGQSITTGCKVAMIRYLM